MENFHFTEKLINKDVEVLWFTNIGYKYMINPQIYIFGQK